MEFFSIISLNEIIEITQKFTTNGMANILNQPDIAFKRISITGYAPHMLAWDNFHLQEISHFFIESCSFYNKIQKIMPLDKDFSLSYIQRRSS